MIMRVEGRSIWVGRESSVCQKVIDSVRRLHYRFPTDVSIHGFTHLSMYVHTIPIVLSIELENVRHQVLIAWIRHIIMDTYRSEELTKRNRIDEGLGG